MANKREHNAEVFIEGDSEYGWHCRTCRVEVTGLEDKDAAEASLQEHLEGRDT